MKKKVIRVGDRVRVIKSLAVRRVGYPLVWYDIKEQVEADPRTRLAYEILMAEAGVKLPVENRDHFQVLKIKEGDFPDYFIQACAKVQVERLGFGGNERTLHYYPWAPEGQLWSSESAPNLSGQIHTVDGKRVVKTGIRVPESSGVSYGYDGPEDWYESGGLDDMKTHVLLRLQGWEFEECNVELVSKAK